MQQWPGLHPDRALHAHDQVPHAAAHLLHSAPSRVAGASQVCGAAGSSECKCSVSCCAADLADLAANTQDEATSQCLVLMCA